jgi:hypothetical protein
MVSTSIIIFVMDFSITHAIQVSDLDVSDAGALRSNTQTGRSARLSQRARPPDATISKFRAQKKGLTLPYSATIAQFGFHVKPVSDKFYSNHYMLLGLAGNIITKCLCNLPSAK